eukprot:8276-Heterococcus_DN1.PRE.4
MATVLAVQKLCKLYVYDRCAVRDVDRIELYSGFAVPSGRCQPQVTEHVRTCVSLQNHISSSAGCTTAL